MKDDNELKSAGYDFGNDADVVPLSDAEFDAWLTQVAPTLNVPGPAPRLEMWQAIAKARSRDEQSRAKSVQGVIPWRRTPWGLMSAMAAALLLGVAIDRMVLRKAGRAGAPVAAISTPAADSGRPTRLYRMAAAQTLTQAEALLTAYRASDVRERNPLHAAQLGTWGRQVLSSTRLLIDSPAGDDPQLRTLLNDLELVLVQIVQLSGAALDPADRTRVDRARERALIDGALDEKDLLPRIRNAVPAGITGAASAD